MPSFRIHQYLLLITILFNYVFAEYKCGVGIGDITGPIAEINMMGYAKTGQDAAGIHFRLYSRAFVVQDSAGKIVSYVTMDLGMTSIAHKMEVLKQLNGKFPNKFSHSNLMMSAIHTHSGPGGYMQNLLYVINAQGFDKQNYKAICDGITNSIVKAMNSMGNCDIFYNEGELLDANINRSPTSYKLNPEAERKKYKSDVEKTMHLLKFVKGGKPVGTIAWFSVHPTSMNNTNLLVSGDNKGYAAMQFEKDMNSGALPGKGPFVAAFPNGIEGDVSPNTKGARCIDTGAPCDIHTSTCGVTVKTPVGNTVKTPVKTDDKCIASGPGNDMFQSTQIIGDKQYKKAKELSTSAKEKVTGGVAYIHQFVDMSNISFAYNGKQVRTCIAALGNSFGAGTTDGPGMVGFEQGSKTNTVWNTVAGLIKKPTKDMITCHDPKPILLPTGLLKVPYDWQPQILPLHLIRIGGVVIAGLPGEFTTMAGRRVREAIAAEVSKLGANVHVILTSLTNEYASYVTTYEEYQAQRYEGASTIFGPYTVEAYKQQYQKLAKALVSNANLPPGPTPPNFINRQLCLKPGVLFDGTTKRRKFGDVLENVKPNYNVGNRVSVKFVVANPRNDLFTDKSFLTVESLDPKSKRWTVVANDASWETQYHWKRTNVIVGESEATVYWDIPKDTAKGDYRIKIFGVSKNLFQKKTKFTGTSNIFKVI